MIRRGSLPRIAVTCAGFSSFTRSGPEPGIGEGRVIASVGSSNLRGGRARRGAILVAAAVPLFLIAMWVRTPALPRTAGARESAGDRGDAGAASIRALQRALIDVRQRLDELVTLALNSPTDPQAAFDYLSTRSPQHDGESVVVFDRGRAFAWVGETRTDIDTVTAPLSVTFTPFYVTMSVVQSRGSRRAVASAVLDAAAPADRLTGTLNERVAPAQGVTSYDFAPPTSLRGGPIVLVSDGAPMLRAIPKLATAEEVGFRRASMLRARGTIVLVLLTLIFLGVAWRDRHALGQRLLAAAVALTIAALVPWNSFSNTSRIFDPAYYFSRLAGPLTANAAALCISSALILMAVYALIRFPPQ